MSRLGTEKEGKTNREERPFSRVQEAFESDVFLWHPIPEPGGDFLQACLSVDAR